MPKPLTRDLLVCCFIACIYLVIFPNQGYLGPKQKGLRGDLHQDTLIFRRKVLSHQRPSPHGRAKAKRDGEGRKESVSYPIVMVSATQSGMRCMEGNVFGAFTGRFHRVPFSPYTTVNKHTVWFAIPVIRSGNELYIKLVVFSWYHIISVKRTQEIGKASLGLTSPEDSTILLQCGCLCAHRVTTNWLQLSFLRGNQWEQTGEAHGKDPFLPHTGWTLSGISHSSLHSYPWPFGAIQFPLCQVPLQTVISSPDRRQEGEKAAGQPLLWEHSGLLTKRHVTGCAQEILIKWAGEWGERKRSPSRPWLSFL